MIQKAAAMVIGCYITTTCLLTHHVSCRVSGETSNHPGDSAPLQTSLGTLWLLAFSKTKITLEREEISDHQWDSGKNNGAPDGYWENCARSPGAYFEGEWVSLSYVQCFLYLVSSSVNVCFSYCMAGNLLDSPCIFQVEGTATKHSTDETRRQKMTQCLTEVKEGQCVWRAGVGQAARNEAGNFVQGLPPVKTMKRAELSTKG